MNLESLTYISIAYPAKKIKTPKLMVYKVPELALAKYICIQTTLKFIVSMWMVRRILQTSAYQVLCCFVNLHTKISALFETFEACLRNTVMGLNFYIY